MSPNDQPPSNASPDEREPELPEAEGDEKAEAAWLLARESDADAEAPSPQLAREQEELAYLLSTMPTGASDHSWHDAVLQQVSEVQAAEAQAAASIPAATPPAAAAAAAAPPAAAAAAAPPAAAAAALARRPRRGGSAWAIGGTFVAVAAAAIALIAIRPAAQAPELALDTRREGAVRSGGDEVAVGDVLIARARPRGRGDLRVFLESGAPVARCPGEVGCTVAPDGALTLEVSLDAPVQYYVILAVVDAPGSSPAAEATMNQFLDAVTKAGARLQQPKPIAVH